VQSPVLQLCLCKWETDSIRAGRDGGEGHAAGKGQAPHEGVLGSKRGSAQRSGLRTGFGNGECGIRRQHGGVSRRARAVLDPGVQQLLMPVEHVYPW
jgi:hypothetical protein